MADETQHKHRDCGTMKNHRRLLDEDPGYARRLARIEEHAFRVAMSGPVMRPGCVRIPVVVHVVHNKAEENISQAQIDSQIEVLNKDFRKRNADVANVPAPFAPLAADARIQFKLATTDPDGKPTDGVTRTKTSETSFSGNDDIKFDKRGGKDAWPADEYLNIWVGNLSGGLLGYAQFPGGAAATDGVVVTHTGFGTTGTARDPFDKGRTTTHEIGHWLNLRHIWGDDGNGCSGTDFVADTPNQGGSNVGKPTFPSVSCNNGPNGDMFMNYMDYVDDDTMVMFSEGQVARMHACLDGVRSTIGEAISCDIVVGPKIPIKELPKDGPKDFIKDPIKETPKDGPKDFPKDGPKDFPKDPGKDFPKDFPFDPKPPFADPKSILEPGPKQTLDPGPKIKDPGPKIFDPGPKILDPGPKIRDPGPKQLDPGPKIFDPGPKQLDPGPFPGPFPIPMPFVLGTGAAPGQPQAQPQPQQPAPDQGQQMMLQHYAMILSQYMQLNQRGMLDPQGMQGFQQAYEAYVQMGGQ